jgi:hypothetical protein
MRKFLEKMGFFLLNSATFAVSFEGIFLKKEYFAYQRAFPQFRPSFLHPFMASQKEPSSFRAVEHVKI